MVAIYGIGLALQYAWVAFLIGVIIGLIFVINARKKHHGGRLGIKNGIGRLIGETDTANGKIPGDTTDITITISAENIRKLEGLSALYEESVDAMLTRMIRDFTAPKGSSSGHAGNPQKQASRTSKATSYLDGKLQQFKEGGFP